MNPSLIHGLSRHRVCSTLRVVTLLLPLFTAARAVAVPTAPSNLPDTDALAADDALPADVAPQDSAPASQDGAPTALPPEEGAHADASADTGAAATAEAAEGAEGDEADGAVAALVDAMPTLHDEGLITLGLGTGLAIVSTVAFVVGTDAEHALLAGSNSKPELDALMTRRLVAASVAWPTLAAAVLAIGGGVTLSTLDILQERSTTGPFTLDDPPFATRPRVARETADEIDGEDVADGEDVDAAVEDDSAEANDAAAPRVDADGDARAPDAPNVEETAP